MLLMILFQLGLVWSLLGNTGTNTERVCTPRWKFTRVMEDLSEVNLCLLTETITDV